MKKVKITCGITIGFAAFCIINSFVFRLQSSQNNREDVDKFYLKHLSETKKQLSVFRSICEKKEAIGFLKKQFNVTRLAYKKAAIIIDHFNIRDEIFLNGAPIDRTEEDHPDVIIHPRGFQVIEQMVFAKKFNDYNKVITEIDGMLSVISSLENEQDHINKFSDAAVFDAMQGSLIKLMSLGISGFDSQLAMNSIPEANATLDGLHELLAIYKPEINKRSSQFFSTIDIDFTAANKFLGTNQDFNKFDRMEFITRYIQPVYSHVVTARNQLGAFSEGLSAFRSRSNSIFADSFFNINFFSPGSGYEMTLERIELGKQLFNDPILSGNKKRSCASCHKPELAFTDGVKTPMSIDNSTSLTRNTPGLWNSALQTRQFFDSRVDILENQLDEVVHNANEMKGSLKGSVSDLKKDKHYSALFQKAYPKNKETVVEFNIANAIASYVRSLIALNSKFDKSMRGEGSLSKNEKNGFNLFMGKAKCGTCHFMPLFNGLLPPQFAKTESEVIGIPKSGVKKGAELDSDEGKYAFTKSAVDKFSFKTPTLRNIALTAPYMHNGVFKTLEEVVTFYNDGGGKGWKIAPPNQTLPFEKLNLSKKEKNDLVLFMKTLTDTTDRNDD